MFSSLTVAAHFFCCFLIFCFKIFHHKNSYPIVLIIIWPHIKNYYVSLLSVFVISVTPVPFKLCSFIPMMSILYVCISSSICFWSFYSLIPLTFKLPTIKVFFLHFWYIFCTWKLKFQSLNFAVSVTVTSFNSLFSFDNCKDPKDCGFISSTTSKIEF